MKNTIYKSGVYSKVIELGNNLYRFLVYDNAIIKSYVLQTKKPIEKATIESLLKEMDAPLHQKMMQFARKTYDWGKGATNGQIYVIVNSVLQNHIEKNHERFNQIPSVEELESIKNSPKPIAYSINPFAWRVIRPMNNSLNLIVQFPQKMKNILKEIQSQTVQLYREQIILGNPYESANEIIEKAKISDNTTKRINAYSYPWGKVYHY